MLKHAKTFLQPGACRCGYVRQRAEWKYLGIIIDEKFCWGPQVDIICNRLRSALFGFYNLKQIVSHKTLIIVYKKLWESILNYGILAWGNLPKYLSEKIENLQYRILKIITGNRADNPNDLFKDQKILPFTQLYEFRLILNFYFDNEFKIPTVYDRPRRNNVTYRKFQIPEKNNRFGFRQPDYMVPKIFNKLPPTLENLEKIKKVKDLTKLWLLEDLN